MTEVQKQARIPKLHELIGRIRGKEKVTIYGESKWKGTYWYRLEVNIENKNIGQIKVFKDRLETEKIWKAIEDAEYVDKRYLFFCSSFMGSWQLNNWKELKNE